MSFSCSLQYKILKQLSVLRSCPINHLLKLFNHKEYCQKTLNHMFYLAFDQAMLQVLESLNLVDTFKF